MESIIYIIIPLIVIALILWIILVTYPWVYRNPSNRTCKKCGLNQMEYMTNWSTGRQSHWWENNGKIPDNMCHWHNVD